MNLQQQLGLRIQRRRQRLGLTVTEVARRAGYRRQTVAQLERGEGGRICVLVDVLQVLEMALQVGTRPTRAVRAA